jgi:acetyl esterase
MRDDPRGELDPAVQALFDVMTQQRAARVLDPAAMRAGDLAMTEMLNAGAPEVARDEEIRIPGPAGEIRARVFAPRPAGGDALPVLLYIHGGGFVIMSPETHAKFTKLLAVGADAVVVSIDYRLAPESPYPGPLDDCVAAFRWLRQHAADLGGDPARIAVAGDSAGGNLTAATTLRLLADGDAPPAGALLICPWTDLVMDSGSYRTLAPDDAVIDAQIMEYFRTCYAADPAQWRDPFVSPLRAKLAGFPPTCVIVGGIDPLCDDGSDFARGVEKAGGEASLHSFPGMPHDFMLFLPIPETDRAITAMTSFLSRVLAPA